MRAFEKRIEDLELRLAPPRPVVIYMEDPRSEGLFRRGGDRDPARRLRRDELAADAGADAISIVVIYGEGGPVDLATTANVFQLPDNGRVEDGDFR